MKESTRKDEKEGRRDMGIRRIIVAGSRTMAREEQRRRKERKQTNKERKKKRGLFGPRQKNFFLQIPTFEGQGTSPSHYPPFFTLWDPCLETQEGIFWWEPHSQNLFFGLSRLKNVKDRKKKKKRKKERGRGEQEEG